MPFSRRPTGISNTRNCPDRAPRALQQMEKTMADADVYYRPLTDVAADIKARRLSPVEVTKALLARIEALDPKLKSYTTVTPELALDQAHKAETEIGLGQYRSPLHR